MPDQIKCKDCPEMLDVPETFVTALDNGAMSVLVAQHGDAIVCPGCGAVYAKVINTKETFLSTTTRQVAKGQPRIVVPGGGMRLKVN